MRIVINSRISRDFIIDSDGRLRTPMYFEKLSDNAKGIYKIMLETGEKEYTFENISEIALKRMGDLANGIAELSDNNYVEIFEQ